MEEKASRTTAFQAALEVVEALPPEDQETLIELIHRRLVERRRDEMPRRSAETLEAVREGRGRYVRMRQGDEMKEITLEIPSQLLLGLKMPLGDASDAVRMAAAMKLFELGRLSSGAAAHLAGVPRIVFLSRLADYDVDTFQLTEEALTRETRLV